MMKVTIRCLFAALAVLLLPAAAHAQVIISGLVSSEAGARVSNASVVLEGLQLGARTGEDGRYTFTVPAARVSGQSAKLSVRAVGYRPQSTSIGLQSGTISRDFSLVVSPFQLSEVVVTGAGTATTVERLGTVRTRVDTAALVRATEPNVSAALAGKAPGIDVQQQSGDPGASTKVIIRGLNTINGSGNPLYVVDGTPINNQTLFTSGSTTGTVAPNRAYDLNPEDIESIEVLKSAAAAAVYGARGSQGVILITTKKGRAGATRYSLRSTLTNDQVTRVPALQQKYDQGSFGNTQSWLTNKTLGAALPGGSFGAAITAGTPIIDQSRAMFEDGRLFDNVLQVSGGNDRTVFFLSGGSSNQDGMIVGNKDYYRRNTARVNASHRVTDALQVAANASYIDSRGGFVQRGSNVSGITLGGWRSPPTYDNRRFIDSATNSQASYRRPYPLATQSTTSRVYDNPFWVIDRQQNTSLVGRSLGNVNLAYTPAEWVNVAYTLGADYASDERVEAIPKSSSDFPAGRIRRANFVTNSVSHGLNANFTRSWRPGFETRLGVGAEFNSQRQQNNRVLGTNLVSDFPYALTNAVTVTPDGSGDFRSLLRRESYLGQVQQTLFSDLFATVSARNDGFSTFGSNNRRNWFPSLQLSYLFTNRFNAGGMLSDGKLRFAAGQTGTEPGAYITNATYAAGYYSVGGWGDQLFSVQNGQGGLITGGRVEQPNLKPERQNELEGGLDVAMFNNRADVSFTMYDRVARDVIFDLPLPASSGYGVQAQNAASIRNNGIEVSMNIRPYTSASTQVALGFQYARNKNKLLSLIGANAVDLPTGGYFNGTLISAIPGYGVGAFRSPDFARCRYGAASNKVGTADINAACTAAGAPEGAVYIAADGFPIADPELRVVGDPNPRWTGAFRPALTYRGFNLTGLVDIRRGGDVWNGTKGALYNFGAAKNTEIRAVCTSSTACTGNERVFGTNFTPGRSQEDPGTFPVVGPGAGKAVPIGENWFTGLGSGFNVVSSQFIEDGSFVKLREISLAYTFAQPFVRRYSGFSSLDVRISGRNLGLWTDYTGVDPETNLAGAAVGARGVDYFNNPNTRSTVISFGLNR
ncbi:MAG: SusC/RagA family TonB-linked outer membrane protein [Gemmatimonadaceae bacterium]